MILVFPAVKEQKSHAECIEVKKRSKRMEYTHILNDSLYSHKSSLTCLAHHMQGNGAQSDLPNTNSD